jgi:hypothetical protein
MYSDIQGCTRKYIARFGSQLLLKNYKSWKYTTCHVHSIYSCILKLFFNIHNDFGRLSDSHAINIPSLFKLYMD